MRLRDLRLPKDPRWLQIAFLSSFLAVGLCARDFPLWHAPLVFATALVTQIAFARLLKLTDASLLSPVITSFGLTLLPLPSTKLLICGRWGGGAMPNDRSGPIDR